MSITAGDVATRLLRTTPLTCAFAPLAKPSGKQRNILGLLRIQPFRIAKGGGIERKPSGFYA
jgi:hypothetical protein